MARPKQTRRSVAASIAMIGIVLALIAGIATWVALGAGGGERNRFVTGVVAAGSVSETRVLVGKLSRENQVSAAFPAAGTVTKVSVRLGDQVSAGQELAAVDPAPLRAALLEAEAGLAQARAQLSADKAATSGSSGISIPTQSGTGAQSGGSVPISVKALMSPVNAALAAVQGAVADQQKACAPLWAATPPTPSASPSVSPSVSTTPTTTTTPTTSVSGTPPTVSSTSTPSTSVSATTTPSTSISPTVTPTVSVPPAPGVTPAQFAACSAALAELARAEGMAAQALGGAAAALSAAAASLGGAIPQVPSVGTPASVPASSSDGSGSNKAAIAADEASVLEAGQRVRQAEKNLALTTLTSPVDGVVGALSLVAGASAGGASALILGEGAAIAQVEVPLGTRQELARGDAVTVRPIGSTTNLRGRIGSINILATDGTSGTGATYSTRVVVADPSGRLMSGSTAEVSFTLKVAENVLTVPASALTPVSADTASVRVVASPDAEESETLTVKTGAVGGGLAEVTEGLAAGQLVVLADRNEPLPGFDFGGGPGSRGEGGSVAVEESSGPR